MAAKGPLELQLHENGDIHFAEALPKTRSGKIMRCLLKQIASGTGIKGRQRWVTILKAKKNSWKKCLVPHLAEVHESG